MHLQLPGFPDRRIANRRTRTYPSHLSCVVQQGAGPVVQLEGARLVRSVGFRASTEPPTQCRRGGGKAVPRGRAATSDILAKPTPGRGKLGPFLGQLGVGEGRWPPALRLPGRWRFIAVHSWPATGAHTALAATPRRCPPRPGRFAVAATPRLGKGGWERPPAVSAQGNCLCTSEQRAAPLVASTAAPRRPPT